MQKFFANLGGNRVVMALSIARLGDAIGNSILFIVIPLYVAHLPSPIFALPETVRVGILIALFGLVNAILQPIMGAWSDHAGKRKLFIQGGLGLMVISSLGFVIANQFYHLLILRTLQGIGVAMTVPAAVALIAASSHHKTRGGSMGIYTAFRMAGLAVGPLLGGFLFDRFGYDTAFYVGSGFILLGVLLVQIWVNDIRPDPEERAREKKRPFTIISRDLLSAGILGAGFASLVMAAAFSMMTTLEKQFNARLDQTAFGFGLAFSALTISRLIFQIPIGRWSDNIGRKPLMIGGLVLMAPATILLGYVATTFQLTSVRLVQGLASAGIAAPAFAVAADLAKKGSEGRQLSIITMSFGLGIALGPLVAGLLAVYNFQLPFIIGGALCLIGAWVVFRYVPETVVRHPKNKKAGETQPDLADGKRATSYSNIQSYDANNGNQGNQRQEQDEEVQVSHQNSAGNRS